METIKEVAPAHRAIAFALALATTAFVAISVIVVITSGTALQQTIGA
jgi:hypothetical protein